MPYGMIHRPVVITYLYIISKISKKLANYCNNKLLNGFTNNLYTGSVLLS